MVTFLRRKALVIAALMMAFAMVPLIGESAYATETITSVDLAYDSSLNVYDTSKTEGEIQDALRSSIAVTSEEATLNVYDSYLVYRSTSSTTSFTRIVYSDNDPIDPNREYYLEFSLYPADGYDWNPTINSIS